MPSRILLVEDNPDNRTVYRTILEFHGFDVIEAWDGEEGVRRAIEDQPHVILMDISIPLMDGWDATRLLKGREDTRHIPIIALTAHALPDDRSRAAAVGCDGYLAKPAPPHSVVAEVRRFLDEDAGTA